MVQGTWKDIPYRYLSGTTQYRSNRLFLLWIFLKSTFALTLIIWRSRNKHKFWALYGTSWRDFLFVIPLLKWTKQRHVVIYTELPSLLSRGFANKLTENLLVKFADCILVVSDHLHSYFKKRGARVKKIVPVVVNEERFSLIKYKKSLTIGYIGTFGMKDDVDFIIRGVQMAKKMLPDVKLSLMGFIPDDTERKNIEKISEEIEGLDYFGMLKSDEIANSLAQCDTLVMNRTDSKYARTGFPIKLAEYLATGIPTLVTDFEEYHEYISDDMVYFYKPDNLDDFVSKILHRYASEEEAVAKAAYAKKMVPSIFGEEKAAEELDQIFKEMIAH